MSDVLLTHVIPKSFVVVFGDVQTADCEVTIMRPLIPTKREKWGESQVVRGLGVRFHFKRHETLPLVNFEISLKSGFSWH